MGSRIDEEILDMEHGNHHVISKARRQLHGRIPEAYSKGGTYICLASEPIE